MTLHVRDARNWSTLNRNSPLIPENGQSSASVAASLTLLTADKSDKTKDVPLASAAEQSDSQRSTVSLAFSADGASLAFGSPDGCIVLVHSSSTLPEANTLLGHTDFVRSITFSKDSSVLASGSDDKTVRIWDVHTRLVVGKPLVGHSDCVRSVAFFPGGGFLASSSNDTTVRLWDIREGTAKGDPLEPIMSKVLCVALSAHGIPELSLVPSETAYSTHFSTATAIRNLLAPRIHSGMTAAFPPNTSFSPVEPASLEWTKHGRAISAAEQRLVRHIDSMRSSAISPDGSLLAYTFEGDRSRVVRVLNTRAALTTSASQCLIGHNNCIRSVAFSPDSTLLASSSRDRSVRIWDMRAMSPMGRPLVGHAELVTAVAFSPDGTLLASGSEDKTVRVWDVRTLSAVGDPLVGHTGTIFSVAFSADGTVLESTSRDRTVRTWDLGSPLRDPGITPVSGETSTSLGSRSSSLPVIDDLAPFSTDSLLRLKDGWLLGRNGELIVWIPPSLRPSLSDVREIKRRGRPRLVKLDFAGFVCGSDWTKCYSPIPGLSEESELY